MNKQKRSLDLEVNFLIGLVEQENKRVAEDVGSKNRWGWLK